MTISAELALGTLVGIMMAVPLWASLDWAIVVILKVLAGFSALLMLNLFTDTLKADHVVRAIETHHELALGIIIGIAMVGVITAIVRHIENKK